MHIYVHAHSYTNTEIHVNRPVYILIRLYVYSWEDLFRDQRDYLDNIKEKKKNIFKHSNTRNSAWNIETSQLHDQSWIYKEKTLDVIHRTYVREHNEKKNKFCEKIKARSAHACTA